MRTIRHSSPTMTNMSPQSSTPRPKLPIVRKCSLSSVQQLMNWARTCWFEFKKVNSPDSPARCKWQGIFFAVFYCCWIWSNRIPCLGQIFSPHKSWSKLPFLPAGLGAEEWQGQSCLACVILRRSLKDCFVMKANLCIYMSDKHSCLFLISIGNYRTSSL